MLQPFGDGGTHAGSAQEVPRAGQRPLDDDRACKIDEADD
jgi:hypothetical protein